MPKLTESYNLYVLRPDLAKEWHPTKNGNLGPKDVTPGSAKKIWWLCEKGHWWQASVRCRTR
ncbi:MAG TPA: zinc-ribbon domain-containing protein, partial [Methylomicrobium sp.]|nr:zinc-ribbon domain-containing protein [Methylomicrobium sp.]